MTTKIEWVKNLDGTRGETWKSIPGHESYKVSDFGHIWSSKTSKFLKPISWEGYRHVFLYDGNGNSVKMRVHRAVLLAFVSEPLPGQECRHLNGERSDNRLENLAWGDRYQQRQDDKRNNVRRGHPQKLDVMKVKQVKNLHGRLTSRAAGAIFGVSYTTILRIWRGDIWASVK